MFWRKAGACDHGQFDPAAACQKQNKANKMCASATSPSPTPPPPHFLGHKSAMYRTKIAPYNNNLLLHQSEEISE